MKKVLLASTALMLSAGFAAADVSVGGSGRMGVIDGFGSDNDPAFTSRIRISFAASGETDGGLAFGGSIRADNAAGGNLGQSGTVFIEGAFGKLSMGDVDGAANAAVGFVSGVGLTGLGDFNEIIMVADVGPALPGALYEYSGGDWAVYISAANPGITTVFDTDGDGSLIGEVGDNYQAYSIGGSYSFGNFSIAAGYEDTDAATINLGDPTNQVTFQTDASAEHWVLGLTGSFGDFTGKFVGGWGTTTPLGSAQDFDITQYSVSGDYTFGATTLTAFYRYSEVDTIFEIDAYGLGAAYDLGGGASLVGGWVSGDATVFPGSAAAETADGDAWDFGVSFTF